MFAPWWVQHVEVNRRVHRLEVNRNWGLAFPAPDSYWLSSQHLKAEGQGAPPAGPIKMMQDFRQSEAPHGAIHLFRIEVITAPF
jgi:hypothetical protein